MAEVMIFIMQKESQSITEEDINVRISYGDSDEWVDFRNGKVVVTNDPILTVETERKN